MYELMNPVVLFSGVLFLMLIAVVIGILMEYRYELVKMMKEYYEGKNLKQILEEGSKVFLSGTFNVFFTFVTVLNMFWQSWKVQLTVAVTLILAILYTKDSLYEIVLIFSLALVLARTCWVFRSADPDKFESRRLHKPTPLPGISKAPYVEKKPQKKVRPSAVYHFKRKGH